MGKHQSPLYAYAGDVFFTRSESLLGRLIRWAQTDPKEEKTWANHMGVVVADGWLVPPSDERGWPLAIVVEALWTVKYWSWWNAHKDEVLNGQRIKAFGPKEPRTATERLEFNLVAMSYVGDRYGWWKLGFHLADRFFFKGKKKLSRLLRIDNRPICSYLAAKAEEAHGMDFGMPPQAVDPDEALDYCQSPAGKVQWISR